MDNPACSIAVFSCPWPPPAAGRLALSGRAGGAGRRAGRARAGSRSAAVASYPPGADDFAATDVAWLAAPACPLDIRFSVALDGLSLWLFGLTALLMVVAVLVSWESIDEQQSLYYRLLLVLETGMLGVFVARDIILFYLFFEFTLIPLFFLIGIWGSEQRRYAAIKFFLFTLAGSVLTSGPVGDRALGLLSLRGERPAVLTFSIPRLTPHLAAHPLPPAAVVDLPGPVCRLCHQGAAVPAAHLAAAGPRQAPAAGSVILAGVLLKIGTYGFVRFSLPMLPDATAASV